jgi:DNA-binding CsgD family transcriptional regulator
VAFGGHEDQEAPAHEVSMAETGLPTFDGPIIGRRTELAAIEGALLAGQLAGVVIAGGPGVGKTRLAREAAATARTHGCAIAWVTTTRAAASIPFGPLAQLLPATGSDTTFLRLLRHAPRALVQQAGDRRLFLVVDDAHFLDKASAALIHQLAVAGGVFLVITLRTDMPAPDPVVALWKDALAVRRELAPLSEDEVAELLQAVLGGQVDRSTVLELSRISGGNALYLRELVLAGLEIGSLRRSRGVWSWDGSVVLNTRLLDVCEARLESLGEEERAVLQAVAHGEPLALSWLETKFSAQSLEGVERRGLLVIERDGRRVHARLDHPLHAQVLRAQTPVVRARLIHRQLLTSLEGTGARRRDDVVRLAAWGLEAGKESSLGLLVAGARSALGALDHVLAERLAQAALAEGNEVAAAELLAEAMVAQGRATEAAALLAQLRPAQEEERVRLALLTAWVLGWHLGRLAEGESLLTGLEATVTTVDLRDELMAVRANLALVSGNARQALGLVADVVERDSAPDRIRLRAAMVAVPALTLAGRTEEALRMGASWQDRAQNLRTAVPYASGQLLGVQTLALRTAGRLHEARSLAEREYRAATFGRRRAAGMWAMAVGQVALAQGHVLTAVSCLREAAAIFRTSDGVHFLTVCLATLARGETLAGDLVAAEAALDEALSSEVAGQTDYNADIAQARIWLAAARGDFPSARTIALDAAQSAADRGLLAPSIILLHDAARLGASGAVASRLAQLCAGVDGPFAPACATHTLGLATHDGGVLDNAAAAFEALGAYLLAAEAAASASVAHWQHGPRGSALRSGAAARRLLGMCEGASSPALVPIGTPALTARERDVATLASSGLSNRLIAQRLDISVRTVENYLQNAYSKLGVSSRQELAALVAAQQHPRSK